jgi:hypothetical protein
MAEAGTFSNHRARNWLTGLTVSHGFFFIFYRRIIKYSEETTAAFYNAVNSLSFVFRSCLTWYNLAIENSDVEQLGLNEVRWDKHIDTHN